MAGTGSKQEDQIITVGLEKATGAKFIYVPFKGGGEVAVQLVGKHVTPGQQPRRGRRAVARRQLRALCVFDEKRMPYTARITDTMSWGDVPTCKEAGVPTHYTMLRGILMAPGVSPERSQFYVDMLKKVRETPEWKVLHGKRRLQPDLHDGDADSTSGWAPRQQPVELMEKAGFLAK